MGIVHFLNVKEGDCHIIRHPSGHTTVIDVCNAYTDKESHLVEGTTFVAKSLGVSGNFNQKKNPENPVSYLNNIGVNSIFRFILTHPDMDHMDGIKALFNQFGPTNFWDTENQKEIENFKKMYNQDDWDFYRDIRNCDPNDDPKRLTLYSGARGKYFNQNEDESSGGDGLHILSPTKELLNKCNEEDNWNDASYVILYRTNQGRRFLFTGDAHDDTWEHLLENHAADIEDVDVLIAPHHGRDSGADFSFLDTVRPKLTLFGNASSKHLAYDKWQSRNLRYITNNQAGTVILDPDKDDFEVYVTCQSFAEAYRKSIGGTTFKHDIFDAYYVLDIS